MYKNKIFFSLTDLYVSNERVRPSPRFIVLCLLILGLQRPAIRAHGKF